MSSNIKLHVGLAPAGSQNPIQPLAHLLPPLSRTGGENT